MGDDPWYRGGLRFGCQRCGACCTGDPGYVYLRRGEADAMISYLGVGPETFGRDYTRMSGGRTSLREERDGSCVFFDSKGCLVYPVRPFQCRTFPFWPWNLVRREHWEEIARECPGMGKGKLYTEEEIIERMARPIK